MRKHWKKILAGLTLLGGVYVGGDLLLDSPELDPNALDKADIPVELQIKAEDATKILEQKEVDDVIFNPKTGTFDNKGKIMRYDYISNVKVNKELIFQDGKSYTNIEIIGKKNNISSAKFYLGDQFYKNESGEVYQIEKGATTTIEAFEKQVVGNWKKRLLAKLFKKALAEGYYGGGVDGTTAAGTGANFTFSALRARAGDYQQATNATNIIAHLQTTGTSNQYLNMYSGIFLIDTSGLPDTAVIGTSSLNLYGQSSAFAFGTDAQKRVHVVSQNPASTSALQNDDFSDRGATSFGYIEASSLSTSGYNIFNLNSSGTSTISLTGISKFGTRIGADIDNSEPTWSSSVTNTFVVYQNEETGTSKDPYLEVNYTTPSASVSPVISPIMIF